MTIETNGKRVLGCDVGKDQVVVFDNRSGEILTLPNRQEDLLAALKQFGLDRTALLVCEATGGHEIPLLAAAVALDVPAHRADPRKAHAFARSLRSHAKTDAIDALALARYGAERGDALERWHSPKARQDELAKLVRLRDSFVRQRADHLRQVKAPGEGPHKTYLDAAVGWLGEQIAAIGTDIEALITADEGFRQTAAVIAAIPGCGRVTAMVLVALMPELGQLNRRQAAALAGLAPHPNQSGKRDAHRRIRGGRHEIKRIMAMAALSARRYNPNLRTFSQRLSEAGKPKALINMAAARKLITIINARIRDAIQKTSPKLC